MKTEDLQAQGLTKEQIDFVFKENGKDINDLKNENANLTADRDTWKKKAETAETQLKDFEGKDFEAIQKELGDWKERAEQLEKDYQKNLHDRDYADAIKEHVDNLKFTSESAKKAYIADLTEASLTMKDKKIFGLGDFEKSYKESDPSAFVDEEQAGLDANKAKFTNPVKPPAGGTKLSMSELMKLKNDNPDMDTRQYM